MTVSRGLALLSCVLLMAGCSRSPAPPSASAGTSIEDAFGAISKASTAQGRLTGLVAHPA